MRNIKKIKSNLPRVVLLGRTNVGKSTLFNKLAEHYEAMVSDIAGTTRDIKSSIINWQGASFELFDTGGLSAQHLNHKKTKTRENKKIEIELKIIDKALDAIKDAVLILFIVDSRDGLLKEDKDIALWLKKKKLKVMLVANKADGKKLQQATADFFKLGLGEPQPVSATTGSGSGDLLDKVIENLKIDKSSTIHLVPSPKTLKPIRVSIIGRPNVGKSSLVNNILGEERVIVSSTPHTTREPIDATFDYKGKEITIVDTAGIRRKAKISFKSLEKKGVNLSFKSLNKSEVALLVVDPSQTIGQQDMKLAQLARSCRVGIILVMNKVDLFETSLRGSAFSQRQSAIAPAIQKTFNTIKWAPIILISALTGKNVHKLFDLIIQVQQNHSRIILQPELDKLRKKLVAKKSPPKKKTLGHPGTRMYKVKPAPKIVNLKQTSTSPPHFELLYRGIGILPLAYLQYFEKGLRTEFEFTGTPIIIHQTKI
jgi:GTPase